MATFRQYMNYSASLIGQKVTVPTNPYGGQCVAYVDHLTRWATGNKYSLSYTNAIDLLARARANGFQVFYNDGKAKGDTSVFENVVATLEKLIGRKE